MRPIRPLAFALAVLLTTAAVAQLQPTPPTAGGMIPFPGPDGLPVGVVQSDAPGKWIVIGPDFTPIAPQLFEQGKICLWTGAPGKYLVYLIPPDGQPRPTLVILGGKVEPPPPPKPLPTATLTASPATVQAGQTAALAWQTANATTAEISGLGPVPLTGSQIVTPPATTVYTLKATGAGGGKSATTTVTVTAAPTPTQVFAVIVFESGQDLKPELAEVLRGKPLQDWFVAQKWIGDDKLPTLVRIDQDTPLGNLPAAKAKYVTDARTAAKTSGKPLPLLVWSGTAGGVPTVEPAKTSTAEQIKRLKEIAGIK